MIRDILNKTNISIKSVSFYAMIMDSLQNEEALQALQAENKQLKDKYEPNKKEGEGNPKTREGEGKEVIKETKGVFRKKS